MARRPRCHSAGGEEVRVVRLCKKSEKNYAGLKPGQPPGWKAGQASQGRSLGPAGLGAVVRIYWGAQTQDLGYKFFSAYMHFPGATVQNIY